NNVMDVTTEETNSLFGVGDCLRTIARHDTQHCPAIALKSPVWSIMIEVISIGIISNPQNSTRLILRGNGCCCCVVGSLWSPADRLFVCFSFIFLFLVFF